MTTTERFEQTRTLISTSLAELEDNIQAVSMQIAQLSKTVDHEERRALYENLVTMIKNHETLIGINLDIHDYFSGIQGTIERLLSKPSKEDQ